MNDATTPEALPASMRIGSTIFLHVLDEHAVWVFRPCLNLMAWRFSSDATLMQSLFIKVIHPVRFIA
jgi:hypothetical protein